MTTYVYKYIYYKYKANELRKYLHVHIMNTLLVWGALTADYGQLQLARKCGRVSGQSSGGTRKWPIVRRDT